MQKKIDNIKDTLTVYCGSFDGCDKPEDDLKISLYRTFFKVTTEQTRFQCREHFKLLSCGTIATQTDRVDDMYRSAYPISDNCMYVSESTNFL